MKRVVSLLVGLTLILSLVAPSAFALDGVWHEPYGNNCIYDIGETERIPRNPAEGENVIVKGTTWPIEPGQSVWATYTVNGEARTDKGAEWKYNSGNNTYWEISLGSFAKGDTVEYTVWAAKDGADFKQVGPFTFHVTGWEHAKQVALNANLQDHIVFDVIPDQGTFSPKLSLSFTNSKTLRFQLSPKGTGTFASGISDYALTETADTVVITTDSLRVTVTKSPYGIEIYDLINNRELSGNGTIGSELSWRTDGSDVIDKVRDSYTSPADEQFAGFGERYNGLNKRGQTVDTYVYNQYQNQNEKTYLAVPYFYSSRGYGLYLNSTYYSTFDMANSNSSAYSFCTETDGTSDAMLDYYIIDGETPDEVINSYTDITGKPQELPKWAFGLWMSANEWDRQSEVINAMNKANENDIPATVVVLEQWSDENTFYIWNDATYTPVSGSAVLTSKDFTYGEKWSDPAAMAKTLHDNGMKLILWQVPVEKWTSYSYEQKDNDEAYMIEKGYAVGDGNGGQYRIPQNGWFGNSLLLDFTNADATNWWMSKRAYLFDDIGIDGFKTDGGEMVWGKNTTFSNGKTGPEMRNLYPTEYVKAYNDFSKQKTGTGMTFSRSGTAGAQTAGIYWSGDQSSTFESFRQAVSAGLNAGISGIPYWSWDMAGFTGDFPNAELYKRSTEMAAFCPVMQFHSEKSDPTPSEERSPWNVQERTGDTTIVPVFRKYVNTRTNLLPYIYSESIKSSATGSPMMRAMFLDFADDANTYNLDQQYMFGHSLLVAPVMNEGETEKAVYLPEGEWIDFWHNALTAGGETKTYYADVDSIPVYVKNGSIIPMNLNANYELGGSIGNNVDNYTNLTFRVYPQGNSSYTVNNSDGTSMEIQATENFDQHKVTVQLPAYDSQITTQIFGSRPSSVTANGNELQQVSSLDEFVAGTDCFFYNANEKFTYVKSSVKDAVAICVNGISKAPFEAEHAALTGVSTNTNHTGYYGEGFVEQFAENGDAVAFTVYEDAEAEKSVVIRYSAGTEDAQRSISVNGETVRISLPKTQDWDTWSEISVPVHVVAGRNTIDICYNEGDFAGINLDCIRIE